MSNWSATNDGVVALADDAKDSGVDSLRVNKFIWEFLDWAKAACTAYV